MAHDRTDHPIDERLAGLLGVERRLEAQVREAEERARALVEEARADAARDAAALREAIEAAAARQEAADLDEHARRLACVEDQGRAALRALDAVAADPDVLDRLASHALGRVLGPEAPGGVFGPGAPGLAPGALLRGREP